MYSRIHLILNSRKFLLISLILLCIFKISFAQSSSSEILPKSEHIAIAAQLEENPKDIRRVYYLSDASGDYKLALMEKISKINGKDTLHNSIRAICFMEDHGGNLVKWDINDYIDKSSGEISLVFWTRYCTATDLDGDKRIDPVIVYGSESSPEDGDNYQRIRIITVYKGKKYAIRATECVLDDCRTLSKDKDFAKLPVSIKTYLEKLMQRMRDDQGLILHNH